jgi:hypothetical protein
MVGSGVGDSATVLTAAHGSLTVCAWCGVMFLPRIKQGPNKNRFCRPAHKDAWWNRQKKGNPPGTKISRILTILASGRSLNRFEAQKVAHDHALNSTISEIHNRLGIRVSRKYEIFQLRSNPVRVKRYWLEGQAIKRAISYLEQRTFRVSDHGS